MVEEISGVMWLLFASKLQIDVFSYLRAYVKSVSVSGPALESVDRLLGRWLML